MSQLDRLHGALAFEQGQKRSQNPHDASSDEWMDWMDGFDQARSRADYPLPDGVSEAA